MRSATARASSTLASTPSLPSMTGSPAAAIACLAGVFLPIRSMIDAGGPTKVSP